MELFAVNTSHRRVLIVAGTFPPHSGSGATRAAMFAKYLAHFGWEAGVVCGDWRSDNSDGMYDPNFCPEAQQRVISRFNRDTVHFQLALARCGFRLLERAVLCVRPELSGLGYAWRLRNSLMVAIHRFNPDIVFSTALPAVNHSVASSLCNKLGLPWVADFRDWIEQSEYWENQKPWRRQLRKQRWIAVTRSAKALVTVSDGLRAKLASASGRDVEVIPNGFDPETFVDPPPPLEKIFTITYTGSIILPQRDPRPLFQAIDELHNRGQLHLGDVRLRFVGTNQKLVCSLVNGFKCEACIEQLPWQSRNQCAHIQQASHVLLMLAHAGQQGVLTGKLFEYIGACRPIVCIPGDRNGVEELLVNTEAGTVCRTVKEAAEVILCLYNKWKQTGNLQTSVRAELIAQYNRKHQAAELAAILERVSFS
jgi:glycosyltransferase involved in cell wall biosynthesis